ncbi:MAG: thioredoxin domain-containing protein [Alphaproteobacteria bacterium]|nr:thioredoxin domain-containing protein [Alphaproteobacteria bacterium]
MANELGAETSPYLLQHKDNPVHWRAWGDRALAEAQKSGKPILLSVGYAACHWCHVMAHECFENPSIAHLMNELFVNIKVDREERPDIDAVYMAALGLMGQQGGWPLTMFLTPEGEPFWGGTYFPPEARFGRPGFPDIMRRITEVYHTDPDSVRKNTEAVLLSLNQLATGDPNAPAIQIGSEILDRVAQTMSQQVDPIHGGIGQAPKFPQTYAIEMILRGWLRQPDEAMMQAVNTTLTGMCQGGIYDHLAGGFARYSTDAQWLAPHFEKMLYDNAQLIDILTLAWQANKFPLYSQRVKETIAWTLNEMVVEGGGFAATLDADSEGEEGRFYVWQEADIDAILGDDAAVFNAAYDVSSTGNWEGKVILNRSARPELGTNDEEAFLQRCREKLLHQRSDRVRPGWDDKILADWNGLMIAAMANAAAVFDQPAWANAAVTAFDFVTDKLCPNGTLMHGYRQGQPKHRALLDDYANMARAALMLYEIHGGDRYLQQARAWVANVEAHFADAERGGYYFSSAQATDVIARMRHANDNAVPSGNGVMVGVLTRLWLLTGDDTYGQRADAVARSFSAQLSTHALGMTTLLNNVEFMLQPLQIVIMGERHDETVKDMLSAIHSLALPNKVFQVLAPGQTLPAGHPATGMATINSQATAYVCVGQTCSLPQTRPADLLAALTMATTIMHPG